MKRLTNDNRESILAALNMYYARNGEVWVANAGEAPNYPDCTLVDLIQRIAQRHNLAIFANNPEDMGELLYECMYDGIDTVEGVVALLHSAACAAAEMRARLEMIEDVLGSEYTIEQLRAAWETKRRAADG